MLQYIAGAMKKRWARWLIVIPALALIGGFAVQAIPAMVPAESPVAPMPAEAKVGNSSVFNVYGEPVRVWCGYNDKKYHIMKENSGDSKGSQRFCTKDHHDTDRTMSPHDKRCVKFIGPKVKDGWHVAYAGVKYKVPDLSSFAWHNFPDKNAKNKKCRGKKEYPLR